MNGLRVGKPVQGEAVRDLLAHRLSGDCSAAAKAEWNEIVEGEHSLWDGIGEPYKHTIRAFLVHFHFQLLRHTTERFGFKNGSVGATLRRGSLHVVGAHLITVQLNSSTSTAGLGCPRGFYSQPATTPKRWSVESWFSRRGLTST